MISFFETLISSWVIFFLVWIERKQFWRKHLLHFAISSRVSCYSAARGVSSVIRMKGSGTSDVAVIVFASFAIKWIYSIKLMSEILQKLRTSTNFPHQEIKLNYMKLHYFMQWKIQSNLFRKTLIKIILFQIFKILSTVCYALKKIELVLRIILS